MNKKSWAVLGLVVAGALQGCGHMGAGGGGWTSLYDGRSTGGWNAVGDANWRVADGAIVADKGVGFLVTPRAYGDFVMRVEFYAEADTNSGIFIRCTDKEKFTAATCYEVNIWDKRPGQEYSSGAIVDVAKVDPVPKVGGKWNTFEITAKGDNLVVVLNGVKTVDVKNGRSASGTIGLQYAQGVVKDNGLPIKFRKVEIREL